MTYINVASKNIYVEQYGKENKRSIVYFHGGPGAGCLDFRNQAKALGERYHVVIFDQYGCWRSDAIPENEAFGMKDSVRLIDNMREALGMDTWTVLGHSYGGMLACLYAHTYPNRVDALIYECPSWDFVLSLKSASALYFYPYFKSIQSEEGMKLCDKIINTDYTDKNDLIADHIAVLKMVKDDKVREYLHGINAEELYSHYQIWDEIEGLTQEQYNEIYKRGGQTSLNKIFESGEMLTDYLPYLNDIKQPSLLLVGKYDPICEKTQRDYFQKYVAKGTVVEFNNSGHFPRIEQPQAYTKAIIDFLLVY
jgi:proline iminopeptidase